MKTGQIKQLPHLKKLESAIQELEVLIGVRNDHFAIIDLTLHYACEKIRSLLNEILELSDQDEIDRKLENDSINEYCASLSWLMVQKVRLWFMLSQETRDLLISKGMDYGPVHLCKKGGIIREGDNFLHVIGRAGNVDAFLSVYKHNYTVAIMLISTPNIHMHNPLHELAFSGGSRDQIDSVYVTTNLYKVIHEMLNGTCHSEKERVNIQNYLKIALNAPDTDGTSPLLILGASPDRKEIEKLCGMQNLCTKVSNSLYELTIWLYGKEKDVTLTL